MSSSQDQRVKVEDLLVALRTKILETEQLREQREYFKQELEMHRGQVLTLNAKYNSVSESLERSRKKLQATQRAFASFTDIITAQLLGVNKIKLVSKAPQPLVEVDEDHHYLEYELQRPSSSKLTYDLLTGDAPCPDPERGRAGQLPAATSQVGTRPSVGTDGLSTTLRPNTSRRTPSSFDSHSSDGPVRPAQAIYNSDAAVIGVPSVSKPAVKSTASLNVKGWKNFRDSSPPYGYQPALKSTFHQGPPKIHPVQARASILTQSTLQNDVVLPKIPVPMFMPQERGSTYRQELSKTDNVKMKCPELYFEHGITYQPDLSSSQNMRVAISNLPKNLQYPELFKHIRGEAVISCDLLDTTCFPHMGKTGLVRFKSSIGAYAYAAFCKMHPLNIRGFVANVNVIPTPTYPLPKRTILSLQMHRKTRVLWVKNPPRAVTRERLISDARRAAGLDGEFRKSSFNNLLRTNSFESWTMWPLEQINSRIDESGQKAFELRFTGVEFAGKAFGLMTNFSYYKTADVCYAPDPCEGLLEELILDASSGGYKTTMQYLID